MEHSFFFEMMLLIYPINSLPSVEIWCSFYRVQRNWAVNHTLSQLNPKYDTEIDLFCNNITKASSATAVGFSETEKPFVDFLSLRKFIAQYSALVPLYVCVPYIPHPAVQQSKSAAMESIFSYCSCNSGFNLCVNFFSFVLLTVLALVTTAILQNVFITTSDISGFNSWDFSGAQCVCKLLPSVVR